ncbi:MAG: isoprenylcysteine carboxylmethyltransferase family protein [Bacteroidota bacterium]
MTNKIAFISFISFVILLRIVELIIARSNEKWMRRNGAVEYGQAHYPFIVLLHSLFFVSLIIEYNVKESTAFFPLFAVIYLILAVLKFWVINSLGKFWNTKILRIPSAILINKGPYRFVKHPNYIIVVSELIVIPLTFQLYYTAVIFTLLNALMLFVRIREENRVLGY